MYIHVHTYIFLLFFFFSLTLFDFLAAIAEKIVGRKINNVVYAKLITEKLIGIFFFP